MRSDVIRVSSRDDQIRLVVEQMEKVAVYKGLSPKDALHLRLLSEEMMGMMRAITGRVEGSFWVEDEDGEFRLHLQCRTDMDQARREKLLSVSTSGVNEAERGLMGKIRCFFEPVDDAPPFFDLEMEEGMDHEAVWSMRSYRDQLDYYIRQDRRDALKAWDELERSVVAKLADEVKVNIRGRSVEMVIYKKMGC